MANQIIIKNGTDQPVDADGALGELLYNSSSDKLYISTANVATPKEVGNTTYLPLAGGIMSGTLDMDGETIEGPALNHTHTIGFSGGTISDFKDEDNMASNGAGNVASQQSIKAYVDDHPEWIHFPRMSVRMTSQGYYYLGSKSLGTTIGDGDFQPSDFETSNVPLLQSMQASGECSVSQARAFLVYNGATYTDTIEIHYLKLRGSASLSGDFNTATGLTVESDVTQSIEMQDDVWYHQSTTLNLNLGLGDIIVPVFRNVDRASKYLYFSISYKVYNKLGTA